MFSNRHLAVALAIVLSACGGGGSASVDLSAGAASYGALTVVSAQPADGAVQVPTTTSPRLQFDTRILVESLRRADTTLTADGSSVPVQGEWLADSDNTVRFVPAAPLQSETDYVLTISPLTCDADARILERAVTIGFRTMDATAPVFVASNVAPGQLGRSRTAPLTATFSEALDPSRIDATRVELTDSFGVPYGIRLECEGPMITATPQADLPGDRQLTLRIDASVSDRAGNALGSDWSVSFRTAVDATAPRATSIWPANNASNMSPAVEPTVVFDESMDPASVEASSVLFQDEFGSIIPFTVESALDQRTLRICPQQPLAQGRRHTLAFLVSGAAVTDVSGNSLSQTLLTTFSTGTDAVAPYVVSVDPANLVTRVSPNVAPRAQFSEAIDSTWVQNGMVSLFAGDEEVPCVMSMPDASTVQLDPAVDLGTGATYRIVVRGGPDGVRDNAGNRMAQDHETTFTTSVDPALPTATLLPSDGAVGIPSAMHASIQFSHEMDPDSVQSSSVELQTDQGQSIPADVTLTSRGHVVVITPMVPLQPNSYYRTFVRGGPTGVRALTGNWLAADLGARFRIGTTIDYSPPAVAASVNGIDPSRRTGLVLPPSGFTVHVDAVDGSQTPDMGSVRVDFVGDGVSPVADAVWADATLGYRSLRATWSAGFALVPGQWTMTVRVADLSGNVGVSAPVTFTVTEPTGGLVPFERTQVVWARTDLDRDGNGRADFDDDMLRLGLATNGDPLGTNAYVAKLARDAILGQANLLFGRASDGAPVDSETIALRFTPTSPIGLPHMQMALGGFDPQGSRGRSYGSATTGVLGRAYYDYRNANINDRNIGTSPGLGVFPSEMFLYQADLHQQLYPSFVTMFAQRFLPLCANMGGTPVGSSAIDATIFHDAFDLSAATSQQLARRQTVINAIADWGKAIGTVLAHEAGHAVGLVAPGPAPSGLFGDSSLHNANSSAAEVMAAAVGYEAMISLPYSFRDTDASYLRHRILVR